MAYSGSTAASTVTNPPINVISVVGGRIQNSSSALSSGIVVGGGGDVWLYNSTNLTTDMTVANFFSDAYYLGMKQGDIVMGAQAAAAGSTTQIAYFGILGAVSTAGAALSTGGTMTSTFN